MARILVIALAAAMIGGGVVYAVMQYLERSPAPVEVQVRKTPRTPNPEPTVTVPPTATAAVTTRPTPTATVTATPTPSILMPTEREIAVNAFGECDGQYSGPEKRFRMQTAEDAIADGRQTVADILRLVERYCGGVFPASVVAVVPPPSPPAAWPAVTPPPKPTETLRPTATPRPTDTLRKATATAPNLRHIEEKRYMLKLINAEREKAGVGPVTLGDNIAAQLHANAVLDNCFSSHWGLDGLKPYMRYSLAGGYQSNGENGSGLDYCIKSSDGYAANSGTRLEIDQTMAGWMNSPGHRRNLLDPQHVKVNIGIAWDRYNTAMFQHFEGDYVEYDRPPAISNGLLLLSGQTSNGVRFSQRRDLGVQIYYDPPPHELTPGQVARTYCYDSGRLVAALREPLSGGYRWTTHEFTTTYKSCPSPYDVAADAPAPRSPSEAHQAWQQAYNASQLRQPQSITVPWLTASEWTANGATFAVEVDIGSVLSRHGPGVYSVKLWAKVGGADAVISEYSIFHGVTPPDTYSSSSR